MVSRIVVFALIVCVANAATWRGYPPKKPAEYANKSGCYIDEIQDVIPYEAEIRPIGQCVRIHCSKNLIDYASCGAVGTSDPKCHKTAGDNTKPYPDCCPTIKCDSENDV